MLRGPILGLILLVIPLPSTAEPDDSNGLFLIRRSKNRNEVHYDANIEDCSFGEPARFRHVYVHATEGFLLPTVDYVDIHGYAEDGQPVVERIVRSERGRGMGEPRPIP